MNFDDLLKSHYEFMKQAQDDFEALKRIWERTQGSNDDFSTYMADEGDEAPKLFSPFEEETAQMGSYESQEYNDHDEDDEGIDRPWNRFTAIGENMAEHAEVAPPNLMTDYSMIDHNDPIFITGARLGLPNYVSLHSPYAGNLMLIKNSGYGEI